MGGRGGSSGIGIRNERQLQAITKESVSSYEGQIIRHKEAQARIRQTANGYQVVISDEVGNKMWDNTHSTLDEAKKAARKGINDLNAISDDMNKGGRL